MNRREPERVAKVLGFDFELANAFLGDVPNGSLAGEARTGYLMKSSATPTDAPVEPPSNMAGGSSGQQGLRGMSIAIILRGISRSIAELWTLRGSFMVPAFARHAWPNLPPYASSLKTCH